MKNHFFLSKDQIGEYKNKAVENYVCQINNQMKLKLVNMNPIYENESQFIYVKYINVRI